MKQIPNKELNTCLNYLSLILIKDLSLDEIKKLRKVREGVRGQATAYNDLRKSIWESYGIKLNTTLTRNEENKEIFDKVVELDNEIVEIDGLNFLPEEKVISCCPKTFNQNDIDKALEYLSK